MKNGSEPVQKLKRYIHRNLALPAKMIHESIDQDEAQEYLMEFAHRYIDALLTYCSDILKPGALTNIRSLPRTATRTRSYTTGYFIMSAKTSKEFRNIPVGKVSVYM